MNYLILGAGGHAKVVVDILEQICRGGGYTILDDMDGLPPINDVTVTSNIKECLQYKECPAIIAIGNNDVRMQIAKKYDLSYMTLIHPTAVIGTNVTIGKGTVIMAGAIINSGTVIGDHCIINTGAIIDHDCIIENYVHISPGVKLGGTVRIGECSWIGIGATVVNNKNINAHVIVGGGGTVINDIIIAGTYVGVPAEIL